MSWFRAIIKIARPNNRNSQPAMGDGDNSALLSLPRECQTSQSEAAMMSGPWPSCSVCHGPWAKVINVGRYATINAKLTTIGQNNPRAAAVLVAERASEYVTQIPNYDRILLTF